uniref:macro domain-containing protein n=1 Tax=Cellvibrio fontiphilus TaxID=1815559 RepID=UPI002B4C0033|nr:macro domain-containing protein [Cellvibrio fontiphilus]
MIEFVAGDFFEFEADVRVNTVNCVGVMGAGVALAFKNKYPEMFKDYQFQCKSGVVRPGMPMVWRTRDMFSKNVEIINFPTKKHWRNPSRYEYIEIGLQWLSAYLKEKKNLTITLPALGCGHGGLDWERVKPMIYQYLWDSPNKVLVFEPNSSKNVRKVASEREDLSKELFLNNIKVIKPASSFYPEKLRNFSEKNLYVYENQSFFSGVYDLAIISSSKPSDIEKKIIFDLIDWCKLNDKSVLFGGGAFDKNAALKASQENLNAGVFLPSGILSSVRTIQKRKNINKLTLLSVGDPLEVFVKKEYMPSVISRILLSKSVVFTASKLDWIEKHYKNISKSDAIKYFIDYPELSEKDLFAVRKINAFGVELNECKESFYSIFK